MGARRDDTWCRGLEGKKVDRFTLGKFIGAGRIGYVYKAQQDDFPESVRALKLIFDGLKPGWQVELKKVMCLELIDGVVHFHQLGADSITHEGITKLCQFTVWDYIAPGENLHQYLKREGRVSTSFLVAVVERILHVLHACEAQGVSRHGDLHSGNILIGDHTIARLDDSLQPRAPIYVSDFGYGTTGAVTTPKDDYEGLSQIINEMIPFIDYATATATHRQILQAMQRDLGKLLREPAATERTHPLALLKVLGDLKKSAQGGDRRVPNATTTGSVTPTAGETPSVGQFQVSEMIGDRWDWWRRLFVPTVPARSRILALDIPTVVTGPRGCGKTMLFRRLSERLVVECGEVADLPTGRGFVALYVNANDFADAFAHFPEHPTPEDEGRLICYANLCILADLLTVQSARAGRFNERANDSLLALVQSLLVPNTFSGLVVGEDRLERYRAVLEQIKWAFPPSESANVFPGFAELSQHRWLPRFIQQARSSCPWIGDRAVLLFIDDFSTPRVTSSMQRVLNRLLLQRSPEFLAKVATEAWSTFVPEDSSGKQLQDGDDYQLVDMGEESLFLPDEERLAFLDQVFARRLALDPRIASGTTSLQAFLGRMGLSKTEFARRLRLSLADQNVTERVPVEGTSQRRGRSRARVQYFGEDVLSNLWSGDTRTMIQLVSDVLDQAAETRKRVGNGSPIELPVAPSIQDRVFRNRGGEWLNSHTRNEPTDPRRMKAELERIKTATPGYALCGEYGDHLKAIVEAFVAAATKLLLGPTYKILEGGNLRYVPRMAFRLEIVDEFRIDGLAQEIYRDLIRYGLFMRDNRGKSVRGTFVPRLYLRRLLLPYCTLALSKRDSVPLTCDAFKQLLLEPDRFRAALATKQESEDQLSMSFMDAPSPSDFDERYDDLDHNLHDAVSSGSEAGEEEDRQ
jgi:hypothetical protein